MYGYGQTHSIKVSKYSVIEFSDTIETNFSSRPFPINDPIYTSDSIVFKELIISRLFGPTFYKDVAERVQVNQDISHLKLKIKGAKTVYYGAKKEFLIIADSSYVIFNYKGKIITRRVRLLPKPLIELYFGKRKLVTNKGNISNRYINSMKQYPLIFKTNLGLPFVDIKSYTHTCFVLKTFQYKYNGNIHLIKGRNSLYSIDFEKTTQVDISHFKILPNTKILIDINSMLGDNDEVIKKNDLFLYHIR